MGSGSEYIVSFVDDELVDGGDWCSEVEDEEDGGEEDALDSTSIESGSTINDFDFLINFVVRLGGVGQDWRGDVWEGDEGGGRLRDDLDSLLCLGVLVWTFGGFRKGLDFVWGDLCLSVRFEW